MSEKHKSDPEKSVTLHELKKEIIDTRNLTIKTDNLIQNISSQIKEISRKQEKYEKKYFFNSIASYIIFIILITTAAYFISQEQMKSVKAELSIATKQAARLEADIKAVEKEKTKVALNERIAEEVLNLFEKGRDEEGLAKWKKVEDSLLSRLVRKVLYDRVNAVKYEVAKDQYKRGSSLANSRAYKSAVASLKRAVEVDPKGEFAPKALLKWGETLEKQKNDDEEAVDVFRRLAIEYPKNQLADDGQWKLAQRLDAMGNAKEAAEAFETLFERYPDSGFAKYGRTRAQALRKRLEKKAKKLEKETTTSAPVKSQPKKIKKTVDKEKEEVDEQPPRPKEP